MMQKLSFFSGAEREREKEREREREKERGRKIIHLTQKLTTYHLRHLPTSISPFFFHRRRHSFTRFSLVNTLFCAKQSFVCLFVCSLIVVVVGNVDKNEYG